MPLEDETNPKPRITVKKNGPYVVMGSVPISKQAIVADSEGTATRFEKRTEYVAQQVCQLCRCGNSKNKPFCDGTHRLINFDGTETAKDEEYLDNPEKIEGNNIRLIDAKELCASARFCHRQGGIWKLVSKSADGTMERVACEEAADCPSGRLTIQDKRTGEVLEPKLAKSMVLIEDPSIGVSGPIFVKGGIPVQAADGKTYKIRNRVTLCRCGKSSNKPFCDSSHYPE